MPTPPSAAIHCITTALLPLHLSFAARHSPPLPLSIAHLACHLRICIALSFHLHLPPIYIAAVHCICHLHIIISPTATPARSSPPSPFTSPLIIAPPALRQHCQQQPICIIIGICCTASHHCIVISSPSTIVGRITPALHCIIIYCIALLPPPFIANCICQHRPSPPPPGCRHIAAHRLIHLHRLLPPSAAAIITALHCRLSPPAFAPICAPPPSSPTFSPSSPLLSFIAFIIVSPPLTIARPPAYCHSAHCIALPPPPFGHRQHCIHHIVIAPLLHCPAARCRRRPYRSLPYTFIASHITPSPALHCIAITIGSSPHSLHSLNLQLQHRHLWLPPPPPASRLRHCRQCACIALSSLPLIALRLTLSPASAAASPSLRLAAAHPALPPALLPLPPSLPLSIRRHRPFTRHRRRRRHLASLHCCRRLTPPTTHHLLSPLSLPPPPLPPPTPPPPHPFTTPLPPPHRLLSRPPPAIPPLAFIHRPPARPPITTPTIAPLPKCPPAPAPAHRLPCPTSARPAWNNHPAGCRHASPARAIYHQAFPGRPHRRHHHRT